MTHSSTTVGERELSSAALRTSEGLINQSFGKSGRQKEVWGKKDVLGLLKAFFSAFTSGKRKTAGEKPEIHFLPANSDVFLRTPLKIYPSD